MLSEDLLMLLLLIFEIFAFGFIIVFFCFPKLFSKSTRSHIFNFIIVYLCINFILAGSNFGYVCIKLSRTSARQKACFSNIRLLQGAVEMYNMDHETMMKSLDIDTLVKEHYLKESVMKPEPNCDYYSDGDLSKSGKVTCKLHSEQYEEWLRNEQHKAYSFWDSSIGYALCLFWHSIIGRLFRALFFPVTLPFLLG